MAKNKENNIMLQKKPIHLTLKWQVMDILPAEVCRLFRTFR